MTDYTGLFENITVQMSTKFQDAVCIVFRSDLKNTKIRCDRIFFRIKSERKPHGSDETCCLFNYQNIMNRKTFFSVGFLLDLLDFRNFLIYLKLIDRFIIDLFYLFHSHENIIPPKGLSGIKCITN